MHIIFYLFIFYKVVYFRVSVLPVTLFYFNKPYACFYSQICCEHAFLKSVYTTSYFHFSTLLVASPCIAFFCCFFYVMFEYALCMCLLVVHSLSLALFPPLPQVLQGTTMQQLQQVQVAQSQATPITVNTSNP